MLLRNLTLYRLPRNYSCSAPELAAATAGLPARDCGPLEHQTAGFVAPMGSLDGPLVLWDGACALLCIREYRKQLPPGAVEIAVQRHALAKEKELGRPLEPGELRTIKREQFEQALTSMLTTVRDLRVWIDFNGGWIACDTSSRTRADDAISTLRSALGSFPARPLEPSLPPTRQLTDWLLQGNPDDGFDFDSACDLTPRSRQTVAWKGRGVDLRGPLVRSHLDTGMEARMLQLTFEDSVTFALDHSLCVRGLKPINDAATPEADSDIELALACASPLLSRLAGAIGASFKVFQYPDCSHIPSPPQQALAAESAPDTETAIA